MRFFSSWRVCWLSLLMASAALAWQPGQRVDVTLRSGEEVVGTLVSETVSGLTLDTGDGERVLRFDEVFQVRASEGTQHPASEKKTSMAPSSPKQEAKPARVRFGVFLEVGGGLGVIHSRAVDDVRCVPCVEQRALAAFDSALGLSLSVALSERFWLRTSLSGFFRIAPFVSGGAQLGAELFFSPNDTLSFGLGGRGGVVMWKELTPVFGVVVTPLSWRFSPHHRVSMPLHVSIARSDYELTHVAAMDFASSRSVTDTNVGFFGGLQYELQF